MMLPLQTFIVDLDGMDEAGKPAYIDIDAYTVWNLDGDLVFTDTNGVITDMIAKGCWRRCKAVRMSPSTELMQ
jgi:hypothetical protein